MYSNVTKFVTKFSQVIKNKDVVLNYRSPAGATKQGCRQAAPKAHR